MCEHRWATIAPMVHFRNTVHGTDVNHWTSSSQFVAFSRGTVGFFAMTSADSYSGDVKTGLTPGRYYEGMAECGQEVTVDAHGWVHLDMDGRTKPVVALLRGKGGGRRGLFLIVLFEENSH